MQKVSEPQWKSRCFGPAWALFFSSFFLSLHTNSLLFCILQPLSLSLLVPCEGAQTPTHPMDTRFLYGILRIRAAPEHYYPIEDSSIRRTRARASTSRHFLANCAQVQWQTSSNIGSFQPQKVGFYLELSNGLKIATFFNGKIQLHTRTY